MVDSSWENAAPPPPKKGLSLFGKVLIGCGAALVCIVLAIAAVAWAVVGKATQALDKGWAEVRAEVHSLRSEQGARELYRQNPGLSQNYPTEEDFLKASAEWRGKLADLPEKRPTLREMMASSGKKDGITIRTRVVDGRKTTSVRMRLSTGSTLVLEMEGDKLTDIQVD